MEKTPNSESEKKKTPKDQEVSSYSDTGLATNVACVLTYFIPLFLVFLFIEKKDREVRFHSWNALFFWTASFVLWLTFRILISIMLAVAGFLASFFGFIFWLVLLGIMAIWIYLLVQAYQGRHYLLPIIGELAEKQWKKEAATSQQKDKAS